MKWVSADVVIWIITLGTAGLCSFWLVWDLLRLRRFWSKGRAAQDEIFGAFIGISIAIMGIIGVLRFHLSG